MFYKFLQYPYLHSYLLRDAMAVHRHVQPISVHHNCIQLGDSLGEVEVLERMDEIASLGTSAVGPWYPHRYNHPDLWGTTRWYSGTPYTSLHYFGYV